MIIMSEKQHQCIFCLEQTQICTIEHSIWSLGNTEDILYNNVCDKYQKYLGRN